MESAETTPAPKGCMPSFSLLFGFWKRRPRKADTDNGSNPTRRTKLSKAEQRAEIASTISTLHATAAAVPGPVAANSGAERRPSQATLSTILWFNGLGKYAVAVELAAAKFNDLPPGTTVPPTVALAAAAGLSDAVLMGPEIGMPVKKVAKFRKVFGLGPPSENGIGAAVVAGVEEEKSSLPRATASEHSSAGSHRNSSNNRSSTSSNGNTIPVTPQKGTAGTLMNSKGGSSSTGANHAGSLDAPPAAGAAAAKGAAGVDDATIMANNDAINYAGGPSSRSPPGARGGSLPLFDQESPTASASNAPPRSPPQPRSASQPLPLAHAEDDDSSGAGGASTASTSSSPQVKPRRSAVRSARKTMARATGMSGFLSGKAKN